MKKIILLLLLSSFLFSCQSDKEKQNVKEAEEYHLKREKIINELTTKYNIKYNLDTIAEPFYYNRHNYSITYKSLLESKYQLLTHYEIDDVYEKDNVPHVSIHIMKNEDEPIFYFDFLVTEEQEKLFVNHNNNDLILVTSVSEIKKVKFSRNGEYYGSENESDGKVLEISHNYSGTGSIIAIRSMSDSENIPEDVDLFPPPQKILTSKP